MMTFGTGRVFGSVIEWGFYSMALIGKIVQFDFVSIEVSVKRCNRRSRPATAEGQAQIGINIGETCVSELQ